jgi:hypothetical protein
MRQQGNNRITMKTQKNDRLTLPSLGEEYQDLLTVDAELNMRTPAQQAHSLLCARLQARRQDIKDRVAYLAKKRGVGFDAMWAKVLTGEAEKIAPGDWDGWPAEDEAP